MMLRSNSVIAAMTMNYKVRVLSGPIKKDQRPPIFSHRSVKSIITGRFTLMFLRAE
jgi:hypothetical protein